MTPGGSQVDPHPAMTDERIAMLRHMLGPNRPGSSRGIERGIAHEALNEIERARVAVVRPTRDQLAAAVREAMYANWDGERAPHAGQIADALLAEFWPGTPEADAEQQAEIRREARQEVRELLTLRAQPGSPEEGP